MIVTELQHQPQSQIRYNNERFVGNRYRPAPEEQLMKAFQVLDIEKKGYLTFDELTKYMRDEGKRVFSKSRCCVNRNVHALNIKQERSFLKRNWRK